LLALSPDSPTRDPCSDLQTQAYGLTWMNSIPVTSGFDRSVGNSI
jgi:hypothetical protein